MHLDTILAIRDAFKRLRITQCTSDADQKWLYIKREKVAGAEEDFKLHYPSADKSREIIKRVYSAESYLGTEVLKNIEYYFVRHIMYTALADKITYAALEVDGWDEKIIRYRINNKNRASVIEDEEYLLSDKLETAWLVMEGYRIRELVGTRVDVITPLGITRHPTEYNCSCSESRKKGGRPCIHMKLRQKYMANRASFIISGIATQEG